MGEFTKDWAEPFYGFSIFMGAVISAFFLIVISNPHTVAEYPAWVQNHITLLRILVTIIWIVGGEIVYFLTIKEGLGFWKTLLAKIGCILSVGFWLLLLTLICLLGTLLYLLIFDVVTPNIGSIFVGTATLLGAAFVVYIWVRLNMYLKNQRMQKSVSRKRR